MLNIGCHLSSADGFLAMGKDAVAICQYVPVFHP